MDKSKRDPKQELQRRKRIEWVFTELPFLALSIGLVTMSVILFIEILSQMSLDQRNFIAGFVLVVLCLMTLAGIYTHNGERIEELEKIVKQEKSNHE